MTPQLTDDQRQALSDHRGEPVYVVDTETKAQYVLLPAATYERVSSLFEADGSPVRDAYPLQEPIARREGWTDPAMDAYDEYDAHHTRR